jgi:hypothetical protein
MSRSGVAHHLETAHFWEDNVKINDCLQVPNPTEQNTTAWKGTPRMLDTSLDEPHSDAVESRLQDLNILGTPNTIYPVVVCCDPNTWNKCMTMTDW